MASANPFLPAVKEALKARIALSGPSGSGKTYTALRMATELAGPGGTIAYVDTEHRSASLYADLFKFDAKDFQPPYIPQRLIDDLRAAEAHGYAVCVIDSGTHFWSGPGGILEIVDKNARNGNSWTGWAVATPIQQAMVDTMISVDMHVIMCMRSKQEWALEERNGKQVPTRIGMAPQQRGDIEYEFTVFGELDLDHRLTVGKSRCPLLAGVVDVNPGEQFARTLADWLGDGADPNQRYVDVGWTDRADHDGAVQAMIQRGRSLNELQKQQFTDNRREAQLPSLSSQLITKAEAEAIDAIFTGVISPGEPPQAAQERSEPSPAPTVAPEASRASQAEVAPDRLGAATAYVAGLDKVDVLNAISHLPPEVDFGTPRNDVDRRTALAAALASDPNWTPVQAGAASA